MKKKEVKAELKAARIIANCNANNAVSLINELQDIKKRNEALTISRDQFKESVEQLTKQLNDALAAIPRFTWDNVWQQTQGRSHRYVMKEAYDKIYATNCGLLKECKKKKEENKALHQTVSTLELSCKWSLSEIEKLKRDKTDENFSRNQVEEKDRVIGELNQEIFDLQTKLKEYEKNENKDLGNTLFDDLPF